MIDHEALVEKYLVLPTALARSIDAEFEHVMTKIKKKLVNGGIPRMLSSAGSEVFIKSICEAIPTYLRVASDYLKLFARNSLVLLQDSGGVEMKIDVESTGEDGTTLQFICLGAVWDPKASRCSRSRDVV